jgi:hypothetical protein
MAEVRWLGPDKQARRRAHRYQGSQAMPSLMTVALKVASFTARMLIVLAFYLLIYSIANAIN